MLGPDRLRSAPTTQSQPILLLSDRFSCARSACDKRKKKKKKRVYHGAQSPPPDVHACTIARTSLDADETGRAAVVGAFCSQRPCTSPDTAKEVRSWPVAAAIVAHACRGVCPVLFPAAHAATRRRQRARPSTSRRELVAPSCREPRTRTPTK